MAARNIAIGWISPGQVAADFAVSLGNTLMLDNGKHRIHQLIGVESSPRIAEGRSQVVDGFLRGASNGTKMDWLLTVDADMGWGYEDFELLCSVADKDTCPIVGGLAFGGGRSMGIFPTIYSLSQDEDGLIQVGKVMDYPRNQLVKVGATGAAFMLVHRSVFMKMGKALRTDPEGFNNPYPWYAETSNRGRPFGEDVTFCMRAQALGFPVHVHTGVKTTHLKLHRLTEELFDAHTDELERLEAKQLVLPGRELVRNG